MRFLWTKNIWTYNYILCIHDLFWDLALQLQGLLKQSLYGCSLGSDAEASSQW